MNTVIKDNNSAAPTYYREYTKDNNNVLQRTATLINLNGVKDLGDYALSNAYRSTLLTGTLDLSTLENITGINACSFAFSSSGGITSVNMSNVKTITGTGACSNMFLDCIGITSVDLGSLETVGGCESMFSNCNKLATLDISSLKTISSACSSMFKGTKITSLDLSALETISGSCNSMFESCTSLTTADLRSLKTISGTFASAFRYCTALTSIDLSALETISASCSEIFGSTKLTTFTFNNLSSLDANQALYRAFRNVTTLTSLSFPALKSTSFGSYTNQFSNMLQGVTGCTVHFPSNLQSVIGSWSDVTGGFGGTNTTVLFDLTATE